jgi:hypothetical protein
MVLHRVRRHVQLARDVAGGPALENQPGDVLLAWAQSQRLQVQGGDGARLRGLNERPAPAS